MVNGKELFRSGRFSVWYNAGLATDREIGYRSIVLLRLGKIWIYW